jgi:RHS repeat-associated protein
VTYAYDSGANAKGHLTSLIDQAGTASYTYDILGRLATETRTIAGVSKSTGYTYNLDGSVKTLTYPSGRVVTYTPDSAGRLVSAADGSGTNYVLSASYNPDGSLKSLLNGSTPALNQSFLYTPRLQMCRITALTSGVLPTSCTDTTHIGNIMDRGYDFHAGTGVAGSGTDNGNVFGITNYRDTNRSQAFTYDALNRLASGWSSANTGTYSWGENYSIDAWGNLQIVPMGNKAHGGNFTLSGNVQNRPTGMAYDAAGNLMSYLSATYTYDQENRLSSTAGVTYTYDANGERVLKSNAVGGAAVKRYWSMGGNTLAEGDGSGNLTAEYIYFGSKRVARIDLPANTVHYYLSDHLSSTSLVASAAGAVEEESDYYPFGTEMLVTGPGANYYKFTGKERDIETGLDYFGARYYASSMGRWMSPDWSVKFEPVPYAKLDNPQSLNLYAYVYNNPLRAADPDGHESNADKDKKLPTPDAQHDHTITVRQVSGQGANIAGHVTVQVDGGKELGYGPKQNMTTVQVLQNTPVPGTVEPRAAGVKTEDQVTVHVRGDQAKAAQGTIDAVAKSPGNYQLVGNNCANFAEKVVNSAGGNAPPDIKPGALVEDMRKQQYKDNSVQTSTSH